MDRFNNLTNINLNIDLLTKTNLDPSDIIVIALMNAFKDDDNVCTLNLSNIMVLTHLTAYKLKKSINRLFKARFLKNVMKNFQVDGYRVCVDEYLNKEVTKKTVARNRKKL